eukprot:scaffold22373_cov35-Prasinocladus_malaysianus.AAC.1
MGASAPEGRRPAGRKPPVSDGVAEKMTPRGGRRQLLAGLNQFEAWSFATYMDNMYNNCFAVCITVLSPEEGLGDVCVKGRAS